MVFSWSISSSLLSSSRSTATTIVATATTIGVILIIVVAAAAAVSQRRRKKTDASRTSLGSIRSQIIYATTARSGITGTDTESSSSYILHKVRIP